MIQKEIAYLPQLNDCNGDMSPGKKWFVYYSYRNPHTGRMDRFKDYDGFGKLKTKSERYAHGKKLEIYWRRKLKSGYNPFKDKNVIYSSGDTQISYNSRISTEQHLLKTLSLVTTADREKSITNYKCYIEHFVSWLKKTRLFEYDISLLTESNAEDFLQYLIEEKKLSNKTHNEILSLLKRIFSTLLRKRITDSNPFQYLKNRKHYSQPGVFYPDHLRFMILDKIEKEDPVLFEFFMYTYYLMRRKTEFMEIQLKHIDMEQALIALPERTAKTGQLQYVNIPQQLYKILVEKKLHEYPEDHFLISRDGKPSPKKVGKNFFYKRWKKHRKELGLSNRYGIYNWKHTASVTMRVSGFDLKEIQEHGGWTTLQMVANYMKSFSIRGSEKIRQQFPDIRTNTAMQQSLLLGARATMHQENSLPA